MGRIAQPKVDPVTRLTNRQRKLGEVQRAARLLLTHMRHGRIRGHYLIPPACVLALCQAVDEADDIAKGGEG